MPWRNKYITLTHKFGCLRVSQRQLGTLVFCTLSLAVYLFWHTKSNGRRVTEYIFGNRELQQTFNDAQSATVRRLHFRADPYDAADFLSMYTRGPEVQLTSEQMKRFRSLLQNASSYKWPDDTAKNCAVDYGVLFAFKTSNQQLYIALCFQCNQLDLLRQVEGKLVRINKVGDFDPGRSGFARLVKSIFVDDSEIQNL